MALTKPHTVEIGLDTHLINEGVLDSLEMVNFLLYSGIDKATHCRDRTGHPFNQ